VARGGEEQVLGFLELLRGGDVTEVDHTLAAVAERRAQHVEPPPARQLVRAPLTRLGQRERRRRAHHLAGRHASDPVRGRVPLLHVPLLVKHRDAVRAAVDDRALVCPLPHDLFERHRVGQRHPGVAGEQLEQFKFDVAEGAPAVQGVERPVRPPAHVRQAQRDGVQPGKRRPDQVVELAGLAGRHHHSLPRPEEFADQAVRQRRDAPAQPGGQARGGYQPQPVILDEHEPAGVGAGQLPQAGRDPVEHRLQVALRVHVRDHITETAHHSRALGHVVPGHVVLAGLVADVHPADHAAAAVGQRAGVDAHVEHGAVLADPPGGEGDLAAATDPLEYRVVLRGEFLGDDERFKAEHFRGGPAEHPLRGRVPQHDGTVGVEGDDGVGRGLDDRARGRVNPVPVITSRDLT